jgi:hypothetical protein
MVLSEKFGIYWLFPELKRSTRTYVLVNLIRDRFGDVTTCYDRDVFVIEFRVPCDVEFRRKRRTYEFRRHRRYA